MHQMNKTGSREAASERPTGYIIYIYIYIYIYIIYIYIYFINIYI